MNNKDNLLPVTLHFSKNSIIAIDKSMNKEAVKYDYQLKMSKELGTLGGKVITNAAGFIVQLLNMRYEVIQEIRSQRNQSSYQFRYIVPGKYFVRLLLLKDSNLGWYPGNIHTHEMPSPVVLYPDQILVRANWERLDCDFKYNLLIE
jgi:hypothetical protein